MEDIILLISFVGGVICGIIIGVAYMDIGSDIKRLSEKVSIFGPLDRIAKKIGDRYIAKLPENTIQALLQEDKLRR